MQPKYFRMIREIYLFFAFLCFINLTAFGQTTEIKKVLPDSAMGLKSNPNTLKLTTEMGYRVQVFYGLDRREAFNEQNRFKSLYPNLRSYITYKEPNYYLRVGDFKTRLEAQDLLTELRANFPTLFIFREKINVPEVDSIKP